MSCTLPQACTFGLVHPCLCQYLIQKLFMNASYNKKIMQEQGKQNLESNSITQSFLNESFEAFVD
jgi:K+-transporting ATPase c subunit